MRIIRFLQFFDLVDRPLKINPKAFPGLISNLINHMRHYESPQVNKRFTRLGKVKFLPNALGKTATFQCVFRAVIFIKGRSIFFLPELKKLATLCPKAGWVLVWIKFGRLYGEPVAYRCSGQPVADSRKSYIQMCRVFILEKLEKGRVKKSPMVAGIGLPRCAPMIC
jgi:hypothetical protein